MKRRKELTKRIEESHGGEYAKLVLESHLERCSGVSHATGGREGGSYKVEERKGSKISH